MSDDYGQRQAEREREYREAFETPEAKAWVEGLSPEERRELEADGLLAPMLPKDGTTNGCGVEEDVATSSEASVEAPAVSGSDSLDAILADYPHLEAAIEERARRIGGGNDGSEMLRKLALLFIDTNRRALNADCIAFASGLAVRMGESGTSLARRHGISRQAFHKRSNELLRELGLPPSRAMKRSEARAAYRASNRRWSGGHTVNGTSSPGLTPRKRA
jgi:hypothetical protein